MKNILLLIILFCISSCSISRFVKEGEHLYVRAKVEVNKVDKTVNSAKLEEQLITVLSPKPNRKTLGFRWRLRMYLRAKNKEKGIRYWMKNKFGEPPVWYDEKIVENVEQLILNRAENNGFFHASVQHELKFKRKRKKVSVLYTLNLNTPYRISDINFPTGTTAFMKEIAALKENSLLQKGRPYNLDRIKRERQRIEQYLKEKGYYYFSGNYLHFVADSTSGNRQISLKLDLKENVPKEHLQKYTINNIYVFSDYDLKKQNVPKDTIRTSQFYIIANWQTLKIAVLENALLLKEGKTYSLQAHRGSLKKLVNLNMFKFVRIKFEPLENDSIRLNALVYLTPSTRHSVEGKLGGISLSTNYVGPRLEISYINRNLFRGAEILKITGKWGADYLWQREDEGTNVSSINILGLDLELRIPKLLLPISKGRLNENTIKSSKFNVEYNRSQFRFRAGTDFFPKVVLHGIQFEHGYRWQPKRQIRYEFNPISVYNQYTTYENDTIEEAFQDTILKYPELAVTFENILTYKPNFIFTFDNRLSSIGRKQYFFRGKLTASINRAYPSKYSQNENSQSQYCILETDSRFYYKLFKKTQIATRFISNIAIPVGGNTNIPLFQLFTIGGANSVRAFRPRAIGPGSFAPTGLEELFIQHSGDIRIEGNIEMRHRLSEYFEAAFFVDAGNIWLVEADQSRPGAVFKWQNFYKELALGTGLGIRFHYTYLVIRLDIGFPLRIPFLPEGERWNNLKFGKKSWRQDNLIYNLSIGHPF